MKRLIVASSLALMLGFVSFSDAKTSSTGSPSNSGGGTQGFIQGVTSTNFSIGIHKGRRHRFLNGITVHYNPDTVTMTVDGIAVHTLDVKATGKYARVIGTMKNNVLEASSITITSSAPPRHSKKKSSSQQ